MIDNGKNKPYAHDLVDIGREYLSEYGSMIFENILDANATKNVTVFN